MTGWQAAAVHGTTLSQPLATVVAAIAGALITGFGAAAIKHRWDVESDEKHWQRQRDNRVRAQRLQAFADYLAARPDLTSVRSLDSSGNETAALVSRLRFAAANLLILLPEVSQQAIVIADREAVENWVREIRRAPSAAGRAAIPPDAQILELARQLAVEPDGGQVRRGRAWSRAARLSGQPRTPGPPG